MLGISGTELLLIGVFAFLIFGPDKIPEIMKTVNKAVKMFKDTQEDMERLVKAEVYGIDPEKLGTKPAASETPAEKPAKTGTAAESLYDLSGDTDEEDEE